MKPFTSHFDLSPKVKVSFRSVALCVRCFAGSADRVGALHISLRGTAQADGDAGATSHARATRSEQRNMEAALSLSAPAVARWAFRVGNQIALHSSFSRATSPARRQIKSSIIYDGRLHALLCSEKLRRSNLAISRPRSCRKASLQNRGRSVDFCSVRPDFIDK
jgi:hypothetical protein